MEHVSKSYDLRAFGYTFGFTGYLPKAPGTWASVLTVMLVALVGMSDLYSLHFMIAMVVVFCIFSIVLYGKASERLGTKDPAEFVVDEAAGMTVACLSASCYNFEPCILLVAFLSFRLFDIWKPWIIGIVDRKMHGAWGVLIDDLLAGIMALAVATAAGMQWMPVE